MLGAVDRSFSLHMCAAEPALRPVHLLLPWPLLPLACQLSTSCQALTVSTKALSCAETPVHVAEQLLGPVHLLLPLPFAAPAALLPFPAATSLHPAHHHE